VSRSDGFSYSLTVSLTRPIIVFVIVFSHRKPVVLYLSASA